MTNSHEALNRQRVLQEQTTTTEQLGVPHRASELAEEIERQLGPHFQKYGCIGIDLAPHKWAQIIASLRKASVGEDVREVAKQITEQAVTYFGNPASRKSRVFTDTILPILARLQSQASGEDGWRDIASAPPSTSTRKEVMPHSPETRTSRSGLGPHNAQPQQVEASAGASPPQALMRKALEAE